MAPKVSNATQSNEAITLDALQRSPGLTLGEAGTPAPEVMQPATMLEQLRRLAGQKAVGTFGQQTFAFFVVTPPQDNDLNSTVIRFTERDDVIPEVQHWTGMAQNMTIATVSPAIGTLSRVVHSTVFMREIMDRRTAAGNGPQQHSTTQNQQALLNQQVSEMLPECSIPILPDVTTWTIDDDNDALHMTTWVAVQTGFSPATAPAHALLTWTALNAWLHSAAQMGGWKSLTPFTTLGNSLVRQLRQQLSGISAATFRAGCADADYERDPVGKVIAKNAVTGKSKRPQPQSNVVCSRCGRKGHPVEKCYAKTKESGEAVGGAKK